MCVQKKNGLWVSETEIAFNCEINCGLFFVQVKEEMLFEALTTRKTMTVGERLIVPYKLAEVRPSQQHKPETHPKRSQPLVQRRGTVKYSTLPQDVPFLNPIPKYS